MSAKTDKPVRITLRIPPELHAQAVYLAKKTDRSLNGLMVHLMKLGAAQLLERNDDVSREEPTQK